MGRGRRLERVSDLLREVIAEIMRDLKEPALSEAALVSVTEVRPAPDLGSATVMVSVMGTAEQKKAVIEALGRAASYVRRELKSQVSMRKIPELRFSLDESLEHGARMMSLMRQVSAGASDEDGDDGPDGSADHGA